MYATEFFSGSIPATPLMTPRNLIGEPGATAFHASMDVDTMTSLHRHPILTRARTCDDEQNCASANRVRSGSV